MILHFAGRVPPGDAANFAWSGLSQFQNTAYVSRYLETLHQAPPSQVQNIKKQARHIRYCLMQASEYFSAARSVSMTTKPLLIYYGMMSLALAEILFKGTGDYSLDRARGQHAHHGLDLRATSNPSALYELEKSSDALRALPLTRPNGERFGTFELWHRVSRENPVAGDRKVIVDGGHQEGIECLFGPADVRLPLIPVNGITLLQCFRSHPSMEQVISGNGVKGTTIRATASVIHNKSTNEDDIQIIFHPNLDSNALTACYNLMKFSPSAVHRLNILEFPNGLSISWKVKDGDFLPFELPIGLQEYSKEVQFLTDINSLNEFGILYVGMFIIGNYVRYFPDHWIVDVENSSPLALAAKAFSSIAEERAPLLTYSELSRRWYVRD